MHLVVVVVNNIKTAFFKAKNFIFKNILLHSFYFKEIRKYYYLKIHTDSK